VTELSITMNADNSLVEKFLSFLMKELSVNPKVIGVASSDLSNEGCVGMCLDSDEDNFLILVDESGRNLTEVFVTIAHEMVHVKQYMNENLGWFLDNRSDIPYYSRWWEQEAFKKSVEYVKKFAKEIKKCT